jgi:hypothetical protein
MMSCDVELVVFSRSCSRAKSWSVVDLPDWNFAFGIAVFLRLRRVIGGYAV